MWEAFRDLFFGTPRRAMITLGVVLVLVAFGAIEALIAAVTGLLISLVVLVVLVWILKTAVFGGHRGNGR